MNNIGLFDLVLTSELIIQGDIYFSAPVDKCDHDVLTWSIECHHTKNTQKEQLSFNRADYVTMRTFAKRKLSEVDSSDMTGSIMWHYLNETTQQAIARFVPCRSVVLRNVKNINYGRNGERVPMIMMN